MSQLQPCWLEKTKGEVDSTPRFSSWQLVGCGYAHSHCSRRVFYYFPHSETLQNFSLAITIHYGQLPAGPTAVAGPNVGSDLQRVRSAEGGHLPVTAGNESALVLAPGKVRCSPASPCSLRCAWLRVAPRLPSPLLRARARAGPGRDGKAGLPVEPESRGWGRGLGRHRRTPVAAWRSRTQQRLPVGARR